MDKNVGWFNVNEVSDASLSARDMDALIAMTESQGWQVYTRLKEHEARQAARIALDPTVDEAKRAPCRYIHASCVWDLSLESRLREAIQYAPAKEKPDFIPIEQAILPGTLEPIVVSNIRNMLTNDGI